MDLPLLQGESKRGGKREKVKTSESGLGREGGRGKKVLEEETQGLFTIAAQPDTLF